MMGSLIHATGLGSLLAVLAAAVAPQVAHAVLFAVTYTADLVDAAPGDGVCSTAAATCTLRAAIQEANALASADQIRARRHLPAHAVRQRRGRRCHR